MDHLLEEHLRIENTRWCRRTFLIMIGFVGFLDGLSFTSDPDDILTLVIALVFYIVTALLIPARWFGRARPQINTDGPRPALR